MPSELIRRVAFTIGALLVCRLGGTIPLPGLSAEALQQFFRAEPSNWSLLLVAGGGLHRLAIFALGVTPYITAAVIVQLAAIFWGRLRALQNQGDRGRQTIRKITLCLTALLAAFQAYGVAIALDGMRGFIANPGGLFVLSTTVTLTGGALFLAWLSEQITVCGIGNGLALVLLASVAPRYLAPVLLIFDASRRGLVSGNIVLCLVAAVVVATVFVVLMERAERRIPVVYASRQLGEHRLPALSSCLSVKINAAGIIPVLVTSWLLSVPLAGLHFLAAQGGQWPAELATQLAVGKPLHLVVYAVFIILGCFLYTAWLLDPEEIAAQLTHYGGAIPSVDCGEATAKYIDDVISRTTLIGAAYLALICLLPYLLTWMASVEFYFGGVVLLIAVCTAVDLDTQIRREWAVSREN
jgi:preprotein translocase subunit SecY